MTCLKDILIIPLFVDDNEDDEYDENKDEKLLRRKYRDRNEKDRPLPPLLARVGGSIEVKTHQSLHYVVSGNLHKSKVDPEISVSFLMSITAILISFDHEFYGILFFIFHDRNSDRNESVTRVFVSF